MEFPVTIDSQDAFDGLVKERIGRVEAKYADYGDLKKRADDADAAIAAAQQERDQAATRAADLETEVSKFTAKEQLATWRSDVATATGIPAAILRGSTKEEFEAHAAELKPLLTAQEAPVIPSQGDSPTGTAKTSPWAGVIDALDQQST
ncbi:hypothetical protein NB037_03125 [Rathayibacter sp. ZW T2_19]|uniref:Uncharacterized protein n=1 Tax=Rathayibacter rubneri TaxID=2950106 RepID=A0A9X2DUI0_9MICO|nr:hypothetical protein [Rathayibacter rubneri]MCM6761400.1 hypothetical protein [Rathayibacter rubneri]